MKVHQNTLYVMSQGSYLRRRGETVQVRLEERTVFQVPVHNLHSIVCFGNVACSPFLLGLCGEKQVPVSFLSRTGRFLARVQAPVSGNVLLRRQQFRWADDEKRSTRIARDIVIGKLVNSRILLQRALRDRQVPSDGVSEAVSHLRALLKELSSADGRDQLRGLEGSAARRYFAALNDLIVDQQPAFRFSKRSRRPPLDPFNALISFLYTLLLHDCASAAQSAGLDPAVGFLHDDRPGRPSLALDLMEEFRPFLADRLALSLVNRRQLSDKHFRHSESGAVLLNEAGRKTVLSAYQTRKKDEIEHPFLGEKAVIGLLPHLQATLLARHIRGDLEDYPPFVFR
ncbi:MAG TPA: type I-C CRISPR-associated endonuclease Cas1c [Acidobacteriota bacterium]|nr:type I-C CRISPR-associated endonuclease Cas1c [Acidobacteriota bacterium]